MSNRASANRANARASTGPRTDLGKARSRLNAISHGLNRPVDVAEVLGRAGGGYDGLRSIPGLAEPEAFLLVERIETLRRVRRLRDDALHALERGVVSAAAEPAPAALDRLRRLDVYERKARSRLTGMIRTLGV